MGQAVKEKPKTNSLLLKEAIPGLIKSYGEAPTGLFTGLTDVDAHYGRLLLPGNVTIVAARPSMGKTVFGVQIGEHHATEGKNVLTWSLEMSRNQLIQRMIVKHSGVSSKALNNRELRDEDWPKIQEAASLLHKLPLWVNDLSSASAKSIYDDTSSLHNELITTTGEGLSLMIVDYLQLATADACSRELEVAAVSKTFRCLAKDLNIPVLVLAQLNREAEKRANKRPIMSDLRESGSIEQDAHTIIFLHREAVYCDECQDPRCHCTKGHENDAEIIVAKNRDGERGLIPVYFDGARQAFRDADWEPGSQAGSNVISFKDAVSARQESRPETKEPIKSNEEIERDKLAAFFKEMGGEIVDDF